MAKTIAIVNQKGGVGKTTTCVNLAAALKLLGIRVLVCDFDPQANTTSGLGVDKTAASPSIYDVLIDGADCRKAVVPTPWADVIPSNKALAGATVEMIGMDRREYLLKQALSSFQEDYDYIFVDCPPPWSCSPSTPCARRTPFWCPSSVSITPWRASATCCPPSGSSSGP